MSKDSTSSTYRRPATDEARERANAYRRKYRAEHPDKAKAWRLNYIKRAAARLAAAEAAHAEAQAEGGAKA